MAEMHNWRAGMTMGERKGGITFEFDKIQEFMHVLGMREDQAKHGIGEQGCRGNCSRHSRVSQVEWDY